VELGVLGTLQVRQYGLPVAIPGAKPRAILTMLGLHGGGVVSADTLVELLWGDDPPRTAAKALQTHISSLRRTLGDGFVLTEGTGWVLNTTETDATRYKLAARLGRDAVAAADPSQAIARFDEALALWRGVPELPDSQRGVTEKTRWIEGHAALVEDRADALLATGRAAEIIGELEAAVAEAPLRERRWGQLMLALYRAGRQGEALGAYQRARSLLADELGVDPGPELRRLEAAIITQDAALEVPVSQQLSSVTRAVTFLLTDIEGSTAAWEAQAEAMAAALARHDEIVEQVVTSRGGRLVKTRGEGDATFSVFDRPSAAAAAAIELQEAISHEPWALAEPMRIRVALHTGEVELRDGDYFGRAVNRAARLRSLAAGGQILCSGATAELVIDSLRDDVVLADLGTRQLKNLARPEHVFELRLDAADESHTPTTDTPIERPVLPAVLAGPGPFVGRNHELEQLLSIWQTTLAAGTHAVMIAGEPGVGKTRLAGEWSRQAYEGGALVLYGRCDEDLGAPYQPFAEALRALAPCLGASRIRGLRGVEALLPLVPGLSEVLPDLAAPPRADADSERYALFDAVVALLGVASDITPVVLVLDDLHWAAKPTLLLLRHLLRFGEHARIQIVGTYRSTDLDRSHPLAAMLADLHRDGSGNRIQLRGLDEDDVSAYVAEAGYDDEELARALASVTGGNPFFLIEALRHVDESGGRWDPSTLPQGVREAVSRRLSRLPEETNKALAAAAVVGSRFSLDLVERVVGDDLVDAFDEAAKAGIVIEEPGGHYRFNHAIVRQSLLAELASVRRMRLHQRIASTLEAESGADDDLLSELAYHYFECAWAGNAAKAVEYCRRAAEQAMSRLAYEGAADLYDRALHALEELDDELPDRDDQQAELLVARCEALLAAGDVASAAGAVSQLQEAAGDSARLTAWGTCFDGQLSMLTHPERLDDIESALAAAAETLAELDDAAGEAKAHTVRAGCLARLGRIGDCEMALDHALTAARRARDHRRVNAVLAGAPLAALWGPNPVPRAGGRCLDVVRLLRITTGSPVVEATSTRCQGVLDAFRGRPEAGRRLIDSARRTLTELGMRHALLEVEQFAGIVELVADDPASAESHLRRAYDGFRRMRLDADTAETAALLARACLALNRDAEADELCTESERLAGHALKASMTWRTVRAQLLARRGDHDEARRVAEEAVAIAAGTDALVDHGDACLALATVLGTVGDAAGARAAAEQALGLYESKGAAALAETARGLLGSELTAEPAEKESLSTEPDNACVRVVRQAAAAVNREDWDTMAAMYAPDVFIESRRKIVGFTQDDLPSGDWPHEARRLHATSGMVIRRLVVIAVRGERLALTRLELGTTDVSAGAPRDESFQLCGINDEHQIALMLWFDVDDIDAAMAELDATHARFEGTQPRALLNNTTSQVDQRFWRYFTARDWDTMAGILSDDFSLDDRRQTVNAGLRQGRDTEIENLKVMAGVISNVDVTCTTMAIRGDRLALRRLRFSEQDGQHQAFLNEMLGVVEIDANNRLLSHVVFDPDHIDAAFNELDARYLAGEAAPYAGVWRTVVDTLGEVNRHELGPIMGGLRYVDHRRISFGSDDFGRAVEELWALVPNARYRVTAIHALDAHGTVASLVIEGTDTRGNELQWPRIVALVPDEQRMDVYDEGDLDAALATFEQLSRPKPRLQNAASRAYECAKTSFAVRDWAAIAEILAANVATEDRRRVVNVGRREGRDAALVEFVATAEVVSDWTSEVIATRGERLALNRATVSGSDGGPEAFRADVLDVIEIDDDGLVVSRVVFDPEDFEGAVAELDARYLAGEAAAHASTWSLVTQRHAAALRRHEIHPTPPDFVNIDHRRGIAFAPGELVAYVHATWDQIPDLGFFIEAVHRLSDLAIVYTLVLSGTSREGLYAEWRIVEMVTVQGDLINRTEIFDETDLDVALERFDKLTRPAPQLANEASRVVERYTELFAARNWDAMTALVSEDFATDDRRPVVNAGIQHGRDVESANMRAIAEVGFETITTTVIAIRGEHLVLYGSVFFVPDWSSEEFAVVDVIETNANGLISAHVVFQPDDIDAAFEELENRYLAGEAAAYAHTWSRVVEAHAGLNRMELPSTTPDWVNIDHRRGTPFGSGDLVAYIRSAWDLMPDIHGHIEAVHRLNSLGAVLTHVITGTSQEGFAASWRQINILTVDGDLFNRIEIFDETDLDTALTKFDQIPGPTTKLENRVSRLFDRFLACFAVRDWNGTAELMADDISTDDRRKLVSAGIRRGRETNIADWRAVADLGIKSVTSTVIATRGERLALSRFLFAGRDQRPEAFQTEVLGIVAIKGDAQIGACVLLDIDDLNAAFEELETRYVAGEAAAYSEVWRVIAGAYAAFNRREMFPTTPDWVNIDHRRGTPLAVSSDMTAAMGAFWDLTPDFRMYIEAVHRLSEFGAVVTHTSHGTSPNGFDAEWRMIQLLTVDADRISRCEMFDEADVGAALDRFDELTRGTPRLENAAIRIFERFQTSFSARDWTAIAEILAEELCNDDRRRVVGAGVLHGRDTDIAHLRAIADVGATSIASTVIAIRGERLMLGRILFSEDDHGSEAFGTELLGIVEVDADGRILARVSFDCDDLDAAWQELETRYLAGEAAAYAHTWSVITAAYADLNRHEVYPAAADLVSIDHRRGAMAFAPGELIAYLNASWNQLPDLSFRIEAVHRLSEHGAVYSQVLRGTSEEGFAAEWRIAQIMLVDGEQISRAEIFDEKDLDAALARFDEIASTTTRPANTASKMAERFRASFASRDWASMTEMLAEEMCEDDRRKVIGLGVRRGRDAHVANMQTIADIGTKDLLSTVIATRGDRLVLERVRFAGNDQRPEAFRTELLGLVEINADSRISARIAFEIEDIDAAFDELDARYVAGEAAAFAHTWSVITAAYAAINQGEIPAISPNWVNIDHQVRTTIEAGDLTTYPGAGWNLTPGFNIRVAAVHRLTNFGAVVTHTACGISQDGFEAEWRMIAVLTVDGDQIDRSELFDETHLDAAIARFGELHQRAPQLENTASRMFKRFNAFLAARDWDAMAQMMSDDICDDDRRRVVSGGIRRGRDAQLENLRAIVGVGVRNYESTVIATRGDRLALARSRVSGGGQPAEAFGLEMLTLIQISGDNRISAGVSFDLDDLDAAFEELDCRYLAGEAGDHAHTWSVIANSYAALNRHEVSPNSPDWVNFDHRRGIAVTPDNRIADLYAAWEQVPDLSIHIAAVHRLSQLGAVVTCAVNGTSRDGFDAEWRVVNIQTVEGEVINRSEIFDEADLEAALARFDELQPTVARLQNAASQVYEYFWSTYDARDWDALGETLADDVYTDDRRRVVNAGIQRGRDIELTNMRSLAYIGANVVSTTVATRGQRLVLSRFSSANKDLRHGEFDAEMLTIIEIDTAGRISAGVIFDVDNLDAAFEELDARYLTGEAAKHAQTWLLIARTFAALNRQEVPATTPNWVHIDRRQLAMYEASDLPTYLSATWDLTPPSRTYVEAVHRLNDVGAVLTVASQGISREGFEVEWRELSLIMFDGDKISRGEVFDEADLETAIARFEELSRRASGLDNAASRLYQRFIVDYAARDWSAISEMVADNVVSDDRRPVVNSGLRHGRDALMAELIMMAEVGVDNLTSEVIATRGEHLVLSRTRASQGFDGFHAVIVDVIEIGADEKVLARIVFDTDDMNAAFAELDARYLAGEAAPHARAWSLIAEGFAAINRHEIPSITGPVIDKRRLAPVEGVDLKAYIAATLDVTRDITVYIEAVHQLTARAAVFTHVATATSQDGAEAEWRVVDVYSIDGDRVDRCEMFDDTDLDVALARFEELNHEVRQLDNAATRVWIDLADALNRRDLDGVLALTTPEGRVEDRRKGLAAVHEGSERRRAAEALFVVPDGWRMEVEPFAIRGRRLGLTRDRYRDIAELDRPITIELLTVTEAGENDLVQDTVLFDANDMDAALAELDARYLAGEAAPFSQTWSLITQTYNALNRHEVPVTSPDWVNLDHRRAIAFAPGEADAYIRASWDLTPDLALRVAAVHRLTDLGAVLTHAAHGTSQVSFHAEWRDVVLYMFEGDEISRFEVFDEGIIDTALARFDELHSQARQLENAATRTWTQLADAFNRREVDEFQSLITADCHAEDRRKGLRASFERLAPRDAAQAMFDATPSWRSEADVLAIRGSRFALMRNRFRDTAEPDVPIAAEYLTVVEISDDGRLCDSVRFDPDDINGALAELTARWIASGEVAHPQVIETYMRIIQELNRHDWDAYTASLADATYVNHRQLGTGDTVADFIESVMAVASLIPNVWVEPSNILNYSASGAIGDVVAKGTSSDGVEVEIPMILLGLFDGDRLTRCELFDHEQREQALARFDELNQA
jgi:DNA-binding SARP family transcriptional activator